MRLTSEVAISTTVEVGISLSIIVTMGMLEYTVVISTPGMVKTVVTGNKLVSVAVATVVAVITVVTSPAFVARDWYGSKDVEVVTATDVAKSYRIRYRVVHAPSTLM